MQNLVGQLLLDTLATVILFHLMKASVANEAQDYAYTSFNNIERLHSIEKANICE